MIISKKLIVLIISLVPFLAFSQVEKTLDKRKKAWIKDSKELTLDQNIRDHYLKKSVIYVNEQAYQGYTSISGQLAVRKSQIEEIKSFKTVEFIKHDEKNIFEIGYYEDRKKTEKQYYLIAWTKSKKQWYRELEVLYPEIATKQKPQIVDAARKKWQKHSNAHQTAKLVSKLYSPTAVYLNNKKITEGTDAITKRYKYMNKPKWQITLTPLKVVRVQPKLVYEIGQYQSSGKGHYLILWQKKGIGKWKAILDFNF